MHNPEPVLENETHKLLWDFEIQMDHLISARQPDHLIINNNKQKRTCRIVDFAIPAGHGVKLKESEKKDKYLDPARELRKLWNMKVTVIPIIVGSLGTVKRGLVKRTAGLRNKRSGGNLNYSIVEISQNTEKSSGDLRRLVVTQTPLKDYRLN